MYYYFFVLFIISIITCYSQTPLLNEIGNLYIPNAYIDDVNSIAIDPINKNIYTTNTASGTIDIISYKIGVSPNTADLEIIRSIDIKLQSSPYFKLDYITSIVYSSKGCIIASLIPLNYAVSRGWLVIINTNTMYIDNFIELKHCYSPKYLETTSDGNKLIIACEGLSDGDVNDPEGSISIIDIIDDDFNKWKISNIDFKDFDCYSDDNNNICIKPLPNGIYVPKPDRVFSINVEPEYITIDNNDKYAYITLQENNGVAILDIIKYEIIEIFSLGEHDFSFSGLDASDVDNAINIKKYNNLYGLRQADGISYYKNKLNGNEYILTANEGNPKYFDTLRVNNLQLNEDVFPNGDILKDDINLGRLKVLIGQSKYGEQDDGTFNKLFTFGSRDFTIWQIEKDNDNNDDDNCPCDYPYGLRLIFSSYDDFEQITAAFGDENSFNSDFYNPSFDARSDDKGPEPESIIVGECNNGDTYVFIGLERVGGIMVYDITDIDKHEIYFVQYLNTRDFSVPFDKGMRPPQNVGDIEPETLIFISDNDDGNDNGIAYLIVGYKTSASIGIYSFNCGANRNYNKNLKPQIPYPTNIANTVDECIDQSPCLNIDIRPTVISNPNSRRILNNNNEEMYEICIGFDNNNPYCKKEESFFTYGEFYNDEQENNNIIFKEWFKYDKKCEIVACSNYIEFSIKDGDGCKNSNSLIVSIDGIDNTECKSNENNNLDSCQWKIYSPKCQIDIPYTTSTYLQINTKQSIDTTQETTQSNNNNNYILNNEQGVQNENNKENDNTFDTMTNKGGHFYESTMFYILLGLSLFTCLGILMCVIRSQKNADAQIEGNIREEPLQFEE